jgi:acetolactate synthase-1/2/3 large subunit
MRVVDAIAEWFEGIGVDAYFGIAGGAIWPFMDALIDHPEMEGIQAKHESHAVHMADVYYRSTGRVAPVLVTKGPGLLNTVGAVATAMHDMAAVMVIAGSGSTHFMGKGGMQEIYFNGFEDAVSVFRPITKGSWLLVRPDTVIEAFNQAYKLAVSGRPGPVFIQVPFDVQLAEIEGSVEPARRRSVTSRARPDDASMTKVTELLAEAERPFLLAGGGAAHSTGGPAAFRALVERLRVPMATTLTAKGIVDETHPLSLGVVGRSGTPPAAEASRAADLVIAVGARFSDNHTSNWRAGKIYDPGATKIVQVDLDLAEVARNYPVEVGIAGDAAVFLEELLERVDAAGIEPRWESWADQAERSWKAWREEIQPLLTAETSPVHPARLCHEVGEAVAATGGRVYCDIGDVTQYAEPYMTIRGPGVWNIAPGMAEMGWASTGVLGAAAADRGRPAVALVGDGAFNMTSQILATAVEYALPAVWVILDNCEFGIERKGASRIFERVHPWSRFVRSDTGEPYNPDFVMLARANGADGVRIEDPSQLAPALEHALAGGKPFVIDVVQDLSIPTYFTPGIDRAYPDKWGESYPHFGSLTIAR